MEPFAGDCYRLRDLKNKAVCGLKTSSSDQFLRNFLRVGDGDYSRSEEDVCRVPFAATLWARNLCAEITYKRKVAAASSCDIGARDRKLSVRRSDVYLCAREIEEALLRRQ